jgi:hypothetical protein
LRGWGEREGMECVVREGVGAGGRNDPSFVCTYELKKKDPTPFHDKNSRKTRNRRKVSQHYKSYI